MKNFSGVMQEFHRRNKTDIIVNNMYIILQNTNKKKISPLRL